MTREEIIKILSILRVSFPNYYRGITKEDAENTINIWKEMFKESNSKIVALAVKELINTYKYPPTIADIKEKMYELQTINQKSIDDYWELFLRAIRNGNYGSVEEFNKLPNEVKDYIKSPNQIRELASVDSSTINTVVKGQFYKSMKEILEKNKNFEKMSKEAKELISSNLEIKRIE